MTIRQVLAAAFILAPQIAGAQDYPYQGIYALLSSDPWTCAFEFFIAAPDGSYDSYNLDRKKLTDDGTLAYVKTAKGKCEAEKIRGKTVLEACTYNSFSSDQPEGEPFYDVADFSDPANLKIAYFDDKAEHDSAVSGKILLPHTAPVAVPQCSEVTAAKLASVIVAGEAVLDPDYVSKYLSPVSDDPESAKFQAMAAGIFAKLK